MASGIVQQLKDVAGDRVVAVEGASAVRTESISGEHEVCDPVLIPRAFFVILPVNRAV